MKKKHQKAGILHPLGYMLELHCSNWLIMLLLFRRSKVFEVLVMMFNISLLLIFRSSNKIVQLQEKWSFTSLHARSKPLETQDLYFIEL